ncbi:MAG: glycosyltransferase, partial [Dehalococcoidia bacterium]
LADLGAGIEVRRHGAAAGGGLRRLWFDQVELPRALRREAFDVVFSSANVGPLRSPCRQVLLVRNPIYFSPEYLRRMVSPSVKLRVRFQRWLTLQAVHRADHVLFPTRAMMLMVAAHAGGPRPNWSVAPYGIRHDLFSPLSPHDGPRDRQGPFRLLHVSHYCDQKDLGTLLRALVLLHQRQPGRYHLTLTADFDNLREGASPHCPSLRDDRRLFQQLEAAGAATDLGSMPYTALPARYRQADLFVFPSYTESFGHPLVEAMASGLPVAAADVPVNREMCGETAAFFPAFDPEALAALIARLAGSADELRARGRRGLARAAEFCWQRHAQRLLQVMGYRCGAVGGSPPDWTEARTIPAAPTKAR